MATGISLEAILKSLVIQEIEKQMQTIDNTNLIEIKEGIGYVIATPEQEIRWLPSTFELRRKVKYEDFKDAEEIKRFTKALATQVIKLLKQQEFNKIIPYLPLGEAIDVVCEEIKNDTTCCEVCFFYTCLKFDKKGRGNNEF